MPNVSLSSPTAAENRRRIAFLTAGDARTPRTWSGTPYYMSKALHTHVGHIDHVGPIDSYALPALKAINKITHRVTGRRRLPAHSSFLAQRYASIIASRLNNRRLDLIFAPAGSALIGRLECHIPIVYSSDTTLDLMIDYYPRFTRLARRARKEADAIELAAIKRADLVFYPTAWAARSAVEHYGADPRKVFIIPYGANLNDIPDSATALRPRQRSKCRLLFVGVHWHGKGGDIAVDTLFELRRLGIDAELVVCGCVPPAPVAADEVTVIPFLDKNNDVQRQKLHELYTSADFLLLPTRYECYGIVFCEASAYGVPSITTNTGGVPDVVHEGRNGYTLPPQAAGRDYAALIAEIHSDRQRYDALRKSSRATFEERLNWNHWGDTVRAVIDEVL